MNQKPYKFLIRENESKHILELRVWWTIHGKSVLTISVIFMAFIAFVWLGYEVWRFLQQPDQIGGWQIRPGAIDLKMRYKEVHDWFVGNPVYGELKTASYPPASYAILWLFLGWLTLNSALWLWLVTTVFAIGWLVFLIVQESGAKTFLEGSFIALIPVSMYATGATIGNGQLILHLLPALLAGLLLLHRGKGEWRDDLLAAALLLLALVKPTVSVPFFWIVIFVTGRVRPILLVICGYFVVTVIATSFQEAGFLTLLRSWSEHSMDASARASVTLSHGNLHSWLAAFGLEEWNLSASMLVLLALGIWTYYHRYGDIWLLISVAGLVARFWTYHGWYDDLLILPSIITLFRIVRQNCDIIAFMLLGITMIVMMAPGGQYLLPSPYNKLYMNIQMVVWMILLAFFVSRVWREKRRGISKLTY